MPACAGMTKLRFVFDSVGLSGFRYIRISNRKLLSRRERNSEESRSIACIDGLPIGSAQI
jgi:hypothetical protein